MIPVSPEFTDALNAMMRRDLDSWATFWFWALILSTAVVVVGLFAELPEVWAEVIRPIWKWGRNLWNIKIRLEDFDGWEKVCPELRTFAPSELSAGWKQFIGATALLGWILVAVGVAGEGVAEYFVNDAETNLRSFDQAVLLETQKSANSAAASAALADTLADAAGAKADAVGKRAEELTQKLTNAEGRISKAEANAEQLSKNILEVEAELSGRVFDDQVGAGSRLSVFTPVSAVIEYLATGECEDCENTAGQIALVLHDFAHWKLLTFGPGDRTVFMEGVIVQVDAAGPVSAGVKRAAAGAEALIVELNKTHIQARRHAADLHFPPGVVVIRVGRKPNPVIQRMLREWEKKRDERRKIAPNDH